MKCVNSNTKTKFYGAPEQVTGLSKPDAKDLSRVIKPR